MRPDPSRIVAMATLFYDSAVLFAAIDAGVFGALAQVKEGTAAAVAAQAGLDLRGATLLLDGCVAVGLLEKSGELYRNTAESGLFLVPGSPADLSNAIRYSRDVYPAWHKLAELARTGKPVESPDLHLGDDAARTRTFVMSMHGKALATYRGVLPSLALEGRKQLLDVGGGPGTYAAKIAEANPEIRCTVLDLPPVIEIARGLLAGNDRVATLPGDYHTTPFPAGNDVVLFFGMMHQESPAGIEALLRKAYDSLTPGGVVYVMDMMTDATHTAPKFSALFAVNMALTTHSGWVFSDAELKGWMEAAGFTDFQVGPLPPPIPHWMASARKA